MLPVLTLRNGSPVKPSTASYRCRVIKYIGSKRTLVPLITEVAECLQPAGTVVDLFSGTSRVGHALKASGYRVLANDINSYAATLARCYVQADREDVLSKATAAVAHLNGIPGEAGYFTKTFCEDSLYIQPKNGERVDAMRAWIASQAFEPELEAVLLVSLMEAADRVDSTTGVQMAYLKSWSARSHNDIELRVPAVVARAASGKGGAFHLEAQDAARELSGDIGYLDPPYNQHKYLGNYHIWETLVRWDAPEAYGIARKRIDCRDHQSAFNSKPRIREAIVGVVQKLDVRHLVVSFNNEGYVSRDEMISILSERGEVFVIERDYKRYVGAQIGIFNPSGRKVGKVSHLSNKEFLFVVPERSAVSKFAADSARMNGEAPAVLVAQVS
jgi:adenine-specific DNA-methyltransferase